VALLRPLHWIKNLPVLAPLIFAGLIFDPPSLSLSTAAVGVFCLLASGVYAFNDIHDAAWDRKHPVRKHRPIASRAISPSLGLVLSLLCILLGLAGVFSLKQAAPPLTSEGLASVGPLGWAMAYLAINVAYTLGLKRLPIIDLLCLAALFVLRPLLGAAVLQRDPSTWLVVCSACLALFLATGKRYLEAVQHGLGPDSARPLLTPYSPPFLLRILALSAAVTLASYVTYTLADATVEKVGSSMLLATTPFVLIGIVQYWRLILAGEGDDPAELLVHDKVTVVAITTWSFSALAIVHGLLG